MHFILKHLIRQAHYIKRYLRRKRFDGLDLKYLKLNYHTSKDNDHTNEVEVYAFIVIRNDLFRIRKILDYYRSKEVSHFFIVDNGSTDGTREFLLEQSDASTFSTQDSYSKSQYGLSWIEYLLDRFGLERWCLVVDADEMLYYPHCEKLSLPQLCKYLDQNNEEALITPLIDMYSNQSIKNTQMNQDKSLLDICSYFDRSYHSKRKYIRRLSDDVVDVWYGGVRKRIFGVDSRLSKVSLFKNKKGVRTDQGCHSIWGAKISKVTGALLHFKFFSDFYKKSSEESKRKEHVSRGREYERYNKVLMESPDLSLYGNDSVCFKDSNQLVELGIMKNSKTLTNYTDSI